MNMLESLNKIKDDVQDNRANNANNNADNVSASSNSRVSVNSDGDGTATVDGVVTSAEIAMQLGSTDADERSKAERKLLEIAGFNPDAYILVEGSVKTSAWQQREDGDYLHSYRFSVVPRPERLVTAADIFVNVTPHDSSGIYSQRDKVIVLSDTHLGKSEQEGGGAEVLTRRWRDGVIESVSPGGVERYWENIILVLGGDLIEGVVSQNGKNISGMDMSLTEQLRAATNLLTETISVLIGHCKNLQIVAVPGNHGEVQRIQNTGNFDSYDLYIPQVVEDFLTLQYPDGKIGETTFEFSYPRHDRATDDSYVTVKTSSDSTITVVHGHHFRGKTNGVEKWLSNARFSDEGISESGAIVFGHFHGFQTWTNQSQYIFCAPALETRSNWFKNSSGADGLPGVLTFEMVDNVPTAISTNNYVM